MHELFHELAEAINNSVSLRNEIYQRKDGSWDRLWAAHYALDDAEVAIDKFMQTEDASYLEVYGLLQAFYVQQDAINHIQQTILGGKLIKWSSIPRIQRIRDLRNETVGHPSDIKKYGEDTKYCNIDRFSISNEGFGYLLWSSNGYTSHEVNIPETITAQEEELKALIEDMIQQIKLKDEEFVKQFHGVKTKDIFDKVTNYHFEKIYAFSDLAFGKSMLDSMRALYEELKVELEKRYGDFSSTINAPGLQDTVSDIDELLRRLDDSFNNGKPDEFLHRILVGALESSWGELGKMVVETDNQFMKR